MKKIHVVSWRNTNIASWQLPNVWGGEGGIQYAFRYAHLHSTRECRKNSRSKWRDAFWSKIQVPVHLEVREGRRLRVNRTTGSSAQFAEITQDKFTPLVACINLGCCVIYREGSDDCATCYSRANIKNTCIHIPIYMKSNMCRTYVVSRFLLWNANFRKCAHTSGPISEHSCRTLTQLQGQFCGIPLQSQLMYIHTFLLCIPTYINIHECEFISCTPSRYLSFMQTKIFLYRFQNNGCQNSLANKGRQWYCNPNPEHNFRLRFCTYKQVISFSIAQVISFSIMKREIE